MTIINAIMVPHPPLIIPQVGRGEEKEIQATVDAYRQAAGFIAAGQPDTIVITTPHSVMYADWFHISPGARASGNFAQYRAGEVSFKIRYDTEFVAALCRTAGENDFRAGTEGQKTSELDHATMIPLYFLQQAYGDKPLPPIVRIGLSGLPLTDHYRLGMMIQQTAEKLGRRTAVIASGDLSHRLKEDGPYGYDPAGPEYDSRIMDVMSRSDFGRLFDFTEAFCSSAGECGHRSFTIMAGCFDGRAVSSRQLSYQGPFGVGYGICQFADAGPDATRHFLQTELNDEKQKLSDKRKSEDEYVSLARLAVETFVKTRRPVAVPPDTSKQLLDSQAGVFTTLHLFGQLRGCIGTTAPTTASIATEIIQNGISACSRDPRFAPVKESELPYLTYSVDVLGTPEIISSPDQLDVKRYGVIVSCDSRLGLLLPDLDGVDTIQQQIAIARQKGGIDPDEEVTLQRFEVVRHG